MESYITVKNEGMFEYEDRKSVFIGQAKPVSTEAEAVEFIASVKKNILTQGITFMPMC